MAERFTYPPDLSDTLKRQARRRLVFWTLVLAPFLSVGLVVIARGHEDDRKLAAGVVALMACIAVAFEWGLRLFARRTLDLSGGAIEVEGNVVRQLSATGAVVAEVDLAEPHRVGHAWQVCGNAMYHVRQGGAHVQFSSSVQGAERLVRGTLRQREWPPGADNT